jgi:hypothetical protein
VFSEESDPSPSPPPVSSTSRAPTEPGNRNVKSCLLCPASPLESAEFPKRELLTARIITAFLTKI